MIIFLSFYLFSRFIDVKAKHLFIKPDKKIIYHLSLIIYNEVRFLVKKIPLLRFFMKEKYFTILLYICVKFMRFGGSNLGIT